ncbi:MAG: ComF family protein, partial [Planctomycetaceae bacterium]
MPRRISQLARLCRDGAATACRVGWDFVFPRACPWCGGEDEAASPAESWGPAFCAPCRAEIAPLIEHACDRCGAPVGPYSDTSSGCVRCRDDRFAFERAVRLGVYDGALRTLCLRGKEPRGAALTAAAAELLFERERLSLLAANIELVLPVPQHWTRRVWHGHNVAETIGRVLARRLRADFSGHILAKVRRTPKQTTLPPSARRTNLRGAFD